MRPRTAAEVAFLGLGPAAETFLRSAAAAGTLRLEHELREIAEREVVWGRTAVLRALERATRFRRFKASDVRAILLAGSGLPTPVRARRRSSRPNADSGLSRAGQLPRTTLRCTFVLTPRQIKARIDCHRRARCTTYCHKAWPVGVNDVECADATDLTLARGSDELRLPLLP